MVRGDVLVIRQASEHLLHRVVHLDNDAYQQSESQQRSYSQDQDASERRRFIAVRRRLTHSPLRRCRSVDLSVSGPGLVKI